MTTTEPRDPSRTAGALVDADRSLPTPTEVDDAIADAAHEAYYADQAHDPDPEAWARYDALMALGELRPVPDPDPEPEAGDLQPVIGGDPEADRGDEERG